ncbi:MAG: ABC transporter substrate-binding protein [Longimicrobiales bacterium]|nr:ABC transporter substrate-binding protein [Longimicrobiales bacterium]
MLVAAGLAGAGCAPGTGDTALTADALRELPWDSIVEHARDTELVWRMWRGDPAINAWIDGWVTPRLQESFGIRLRVVEGQGPELVNQLVVEREAGAAGGADLLWINGETFRNLRDEGLLQGPWADVLPSARWVDSTSAIVMRDFEEPLDGFESPWGRVQFALIYDESRTPDPPRSVAELGEWIRENPGRFTHDQSFTGMTFLKGLMYAVGGGVERFTGGFREADYHAGRDSLFAWLDAHRDAFWRGGEAYPAGVAELHRLFANGEVDFSMSNNQNEAITKARQGVLPPSARPLLLEEGTIANAHYLGIPFNARNPAGAMVVADFLLTPEAQLEKLRPEVWGDGTVLDLARLPEEIRRRFEALEGDPRALAADSLERYARIEVDAEYHERLAADWRAEIRRVGR